MLITTLRKIILSTILILVFSSKDQVFARPDKGDNIYLYNGIPGCGCFLHCSCFSHYLSNDKAKGGFPHDNVLHPIYPEDRVWHEFMKNFLSALREGPYISWGFLLMEDSVKEMVKTSNHGSYITLLSDYLNAINRLEKKIESTRIDTINGYKRTYKNPKEKEKLELEIDRINVRAAKANQILSSIPATIVPIYREIIESCNHNKSNNMVPIYNKGLIALLEGNYEESLSDIVSFIDLTKVNNREDLLTSEILQQQGEACLEVGLHHQAIEALSLAISKDPKNLEAHFQRAAAYFEIGNFDNSLVDYINSKKSKSINSHTFVSKEFVSAFSLAVCSGAGDAAQDFVPSLCNTMYGMGECLWTFGEHPIDSINNLANASYEVAEQVVDYLKTVDQEKLNEYADELVIMYENFNQLGDKEKGELIGYTIGKYGVNIFAGPAAIKGVSAYKKLRDANRICNLESMAASTASQNVIASKAHKHYEDRKKFLENSKIHRGRQDKHILGTRNYQEGKSILTHE